MAAGKHVDIQMQVDGSAKTADDVCRRFSKTSIRVVPLVEEA